MQSFGQVFSIWIGKQSQQIAHHFYALQAQQFFDEAQDPIEHNTLWKLYDTQGDRKKPYFLTFNTEIPHLNYIRKTNHAKIIKQMQKSTAKLQSYFFPMQYKSQQDKQQPTTQQQDKYLYQKWQSSQSNYCIIDKNFVQDCDSFDYWKDIYKGNGDLYEDKVRKCLEEFDFLKALTFCTDLEKNGFSQEVLMYLNDQCPKKPIYYFQIQSKEKGGLYEVSQLQSLAEIGALTETYLNLNVQKPLHPFFQTQNPYINLAPILNNLLTPLFLKDTGKTTYLQSILINPRRNIFDLAYTLPFIDSELNLNRNTNIFDYLLEDKHEKFFDTQQQLIKIEEEEFMDKKLTKKEEIQNQQSNVKGNRINFANDYLYLKKDRKYGNTYENNEKKGLMFNSLAKKPTHQLYTGLISQAYVLKGQINEKSFESLFKPNTQLLDLKYLQGITCNYTGNQIKYHKSYKKFYGTGQVDTYPFHTVLFQHKNFGNYLREITLKKQKKFKHECQAEWKQDILTQADYYNEKHEQDDD